ncbi:50S ribosomal protein L25/general stress protein Ctc [Naumannella cuiyingiana]|uniref:Large ribosomal subunit protein bL25 n=1 Tax=Naumannella cuiyingiana TaxID=1347891 RepID=A0A7Z0ILL4_9ACTN|nr:50S ribosomal protein L25/general stress protein Ctc [Naumannella cuiyingiana]NYI71779.1 large subunit ribosomal protein L25 [Naumannella cuiyingiana]
MSEIVLKATRREEFGKGAARRIRRADLVPAVVYGHGMDPLHITLPGHETLLALRNSNALMSIDLAGEKSQLVLPKQVQRDPIKGTIEHVDLIVVRRGEKVTVEVSVTLTGEAAPDTLVVLDNQTLTLEAEATNIPEHVEVSVEGLEAGTQVTAADLVLPEGSTYVGGEPDTLIVNITNAPTQEQLDAELAEAEAEAGIEPTVDEDAEGDEAEGGEETEDGESEGDSEE